MTKPNSFDVLKIMGEREMDIRGFPLWDNLIHAQMGKERGVIQISVNPETIMDILHDKPLIGMLIIADKEQFDNVWREMDGE